MPVNGSGIRIIDALTAQMKHLTSRQQVIAQNIANADTPGYRSHDLAEPDFAKILGRTAGKHDRTVAQPAVTITPRMTALGSRAAATATRTADVNGSEEKPDGNNVVLEDELLRMSGLQTDYATASNLYRKSIGLLRIALGRGG